MLKAVLVQGLLVANIVLANEVIKFKFMFKLKFCFIRPNNAFLLFNSDEIVNWKLEICNFATFVTFTKFCFLHVTGPVREGCTKKTEKMWSFAKLGGGAGLGW